MVLLQPRMEGVLMLKTQRQVVWIAANRFHTFVILLQPANFVVLLYRMHTSSYNALDVSLSLPSSGAYDLLSPLTIILLSFYCVSCL